MRVFRDRLGLHIEVGPWWLRFAWCRYGWSLWAFRRQIFCKPIDYSKVVS